MTGVSGAVTATAGCAAVLVSSGVETAGAGGSAGGFVDGCVGAFGVEAAVVVPLSELLSPLWRDVAIPAAI